MFHCSVIMHCFQKFVSDLGIFFQLCTNKIPIEFALRDEHKDLHSKSGTSFVELAVNEGN